MDKSCGWYWAAKIVEEDYGSFVNWEEEYFICPECGEPVYADDWHDNDFSHGYICPICELEDENYDL